MTRRNLKIKKIFRVGRKNIRIIIYHDLTKLQSRRNVKPPLKSEHIFKFINQCYFVLCHSTVNFCN